ncbi:MAG: tetratricopeptide repeat protein [Pseudomonadota bacterium]
MGFMKAVNVFLLLCFFLYFSINTTALSQENNDITELTKQITNLSQQGRYQEAIPFSLKILTICEQTYGPEHLFTATSANNLALLYIYTGYYANAEPLFKRALEIYQKTLGPEHPSTATALNNLAALYSNTGGYAKAEPLYKRALEIQEKALGPEHPDTANSLNSLAGLYSKLGDYAKAEPLIKRALEIYEKTLGLEHPDTANSLNNLAGLYNESGDYAKAEPLYKRALEIYEKTLGPDHPTTANSLNNLAGLYSKLGDYAKAEPLIKRALEIRQKALGPEHPGTAISLGHLANLYYHLGNYDKAEPLSKRAQEIEEKALGPEHPNTALSLNNLALLYSKLGDYAKAEPLIKRALKIQEKALGPEHPDTASSLNNLALLYSKLGDYAKAEPLIKRALEIQEKALGPEHPDTVASLNNLAVLYSDTGDYVNAKLLYKRILKQSRAHGPNNPSAKISLNNLAAFCIKINKLKSAELILKKTNSEVGWGHYYLALYQFEKAENIFRPYADSQAGTIEDGIFTFTGLGLALEGQNKYERAKDAFNNAIELTESQYATLTFSQRQNYFSGEASVFKRTEPYEGMIRVLLKEHSPGYEAESLWYAERLKSRILQEMLAVRGIKAATPEDEGIVLKDREYQKELIVLNKRVEIMRGLGDKAPRGEETRLATELETARNRYEDFLKEVKLTNSELASLIGVQPSPVKDIQALLDDDVTILEYYTGEKTTYAWLVTKTGIKVFELQSANKGIETKSINQAVVSMLAMNISTRSRKPAPLITLPTDNASQTEANEAQREQNRREFISKSGELYRSLITPVAQDIKTSKLIIVPHGILHKVPFSCLIDGNKFLFEQYELSTAPSSSVIEYIVKKRKPNNKKLIAFANPATDKANLAYAEKEVQEIEKFFPARETYYRLDATEGRAKQKAPEPDIIHFACHGEFNDRQPLQSGLLLAGDKDNDGVLQLHEIFGLNLKQANLVTLSACETALCKIQGGEDWAGMSRGFIYAGTPSILATLWSVEDKSTSIIIKNFYENWLVKGMSKPSALRQAQLDLKAIPEYSHPYYWAPFVMIGDWR